MEQKTTITDIETTIANLRRKQQDEWADLKESLLASSQQLTPGYIIGHAISGVIQTTKIGKKMAVGTAGFALGFAANKMITAKTNNSLLGMLGRVAETVVANNVAEYVDNAKILGKIIIKKLIGKRDDTSDL